jgi:hypothetical protein
MLGIAAYSFVIDNWDIGCLCKSVLRILSVCDLQAHLFTAVISRFLTWVVPSKLCLTPGDEQFNTCDKTTVIRGEERDGSFMRVSGKKTKIA